MRSPRWVICTVLEDEMLTTAAVVRLDAPAGEQAVDRTRASRLDRRRVVAQMIKKERKKERRRRRHIRQVQTARARRDSSRGYVFEVWVNGCELHHSEVLE